MHCRIECHSCLWKTERTATARTNKSLSSATDALQTVKKQNFVFAKASRQLVICNEFGCVRYCYNCHYVAMSFTYRMPVAKQPGVSDNDVCISCISGIRLVSIWVITVLCCRGKGLPSVLEAPTDAPFSAIHEYHSVPAGTGHTHNGLPAANGTRAAPGVNSGQTTVV